MFEVKGKIVVVTGGSGGLGSAICKGFDSLGAVVYNADKVEPVVKNGRNIHFIKTDLSVRSDIDVFVNKVLCEQDGIDVLVNCAAITGKSWDDVIAVNLTAPYILTSLVSRHMVENGIRGSIVNIGSLNAIVALPNNPMYIASKGGIASLTRSFAVDLAKFGIRVNCIHPGYFETSLNAKSLADKNLYRLRCERTALGRWGKPMEIVPAVVFFASDSSSYITGASLCVDGGWTIKGLSE